ncbi:MAG TPA: YihY/virulence factor BrkB family protein, partial [Burkholderiales bacterium]|nr:YihY/virulence factor BrkB family protein [Burkholderiales bacterium]
EAVMRSILGILPRWLRRWVDVAWRSLKAWIEDGGPRLGASIAFYSIFALAPLLVIAIAIAGAVFGEEAARGQIVQQIQGLVGETAARGIESLIQSASRKETSVWASIVGFATLLLGASGVFVEMKNAFDTMWKPEKPATGLTMMLRARLTAIALVLGFGFLAIVSLLLSALLAGLAAYFGGLIPGAEAIAAVLDVALSTAVLTVAFAALIYFLPSAHIRPRAVWAGALTSAVLFAIGKHLIGLYLGRATVASSYGAAGSFVVVILWVYYSAQILLVGAEVTSVLDGKRRDDKPGEDRPVPEPAPRGRVRAQPRTQRA